ncbi:MAG: DUF3943 domain-containing protein [Kiritimatiellales bacterium]|nr:DUF3943 domain-containing protein [Kiritimatiellales bacterium]
MKKINPVHGLLLATVTLVIALATPAMGADDATSSTNEPALKLSESNPGSQPTTYEGPGAQPEVGAPEETATGETWGERSYVIPFLEIIAFEATLNIYDRFFWDEQVFDTTFSSFQDNLTTAPVIDSDSFQINQLYHPYQGAMYFGFGRSAGLSYWQSLMYSLFGSELWETAGETTLPSFNDQIASGIGGTFLGEPLFRMASLVLEGGGETPGFWRELGAACISPPTGINRLLFGERFDKIFPSRNPPTFMCLRVGMSATSRETDNGSTQADPEQQATLDFLMLYGLPGKSSYSYDRPFDYFSFELALGSGQNSFQNVMSHGLLYGTDYDIGHSYRGIWGLYGSYDYISPQTFRVSSTALSLGTTAQWSLMKDVALQYTVLGGVGYGAAGTTAGTSTGERDYRYGTTPQGLLSFRFIMNDLAMVDLNERVYYISDVYGTSPDGHELIQRGNVGLSVRVYGQHALGIQFTSTSRDSNSAGLADRRQTEQVVSLTYTFLGDNNFGVVDLE